jgi:hypothetical protein
MVAPHRRINKEKKKGAWLAPGPPFWLNPVIFHAAIIGCFLVSLFLNSGVDKQLNTN